MPDFTCLSYKMLFFWLPAGNNDWTVFHLRFVWLTHSLFQKVAEAHFLVKQICADSRHMHSMWIKGLCWLAFSVEVIHNNNNTLIVWQKWHQILQVLKYFFFFTDSKSKTLSTMLSHIKCNGIVVEVKMMRISVKKICGLLKEGQGICALPHLPRPQISFSRSFFLYIQPNVFLSMRFIQHLWSGFGNLTDLHHCIVVSYKLHFPQLLHDGGAAFTGAATKQLLHDGGAAFTGAAAKQLWRDWDCHRGRRDWVFVNQGVARPGGKKSF